MQFQNFNIVPLQGSLAKAWEELHCVYIFTGRHFVDTAGAFSSLFAFKNAAPANSLWRKPGKDYSFLQPTRQCQQGRQSLRLFLQSVNRVHFFCKFRFQGPRSLCVDSHLVRVVHVETGICAVASARFSRARLLPKGVCVYTCSF